jgi:hypothetical protein
MKVSLTIAVFALALLGASYANRIKVTESSAVQKQKRDFTGCYFEKRFPCVFTNSCIWYTGPTVFMCVGAHDSPRIDAHCFTPDNDYFSMSVFDFENYNMFMDDDDDAQCLNNNCEVEGNGERKWTGTGNPYPDEYAVVLQNFNSFTRANVSCTITIQ